MRHCQKKPVHLLLSELLVPAFRKEAFFKVFLR